MSDGVKAAGLAALLEGAAMAEVARIAETMADVKSMLTEKSNEVTESRKKYY